MSAWIPMIIITAFWAVIGGGGPFLVPSGPNRGIIQTMIILTAVCCYMLWFIVYLHQLNPLIGPKISAKTIMWIHEKWGDAPNINNH